MEVAQKKELSPEIQKAISETGADIVVGGIYVPDSEYGEETTVLRIREIKKTKKTEHREAYIEVHYDHATNWKCTEWSAYGSSELSKFAEEYIRLKKSIQEYMEEALAVIEGRAKPQDYADKSSDEVNSNTSLIHKGSKEGLMALQEGLEEKRQTAQVLARFIGLEMEKRKAELERIREKMYGVVAEFHKKIEKIMRVITTIELYLGIEEELFQIQSGEAAPSDTPISFRQQVLYMDEEMGIWEDGGVDYKDIQKFDEWLLKPARFRNGILNYEVFLPEQKGLVVFRPRRMSKHYDDNPFINAAKNQWNFMTYLFVRNGQNLYRIYTEKIVIEPRLFPRRNELMKILEEVEEAYGSYSKEKAQDKAEDLMDQYRKRAVLMQGLIDRTEIFLPMKEKISIFNLEATQDAVNFIYDDEASLPSGRLSFQDWWKSLNGKISAGSRVLITGNFYKEYSSDYWGDRFYLAKNSYDGLKNMPDLPKEGVYEVEEFVSTSTIKLRKSAVEKRKAQYEKDGYKCQLIENSGRIWMQADEATGDNKVYLLKVWGKETDLTIMYMPKAQATAGWDRWDTHDRKNRTRFKIIPAEDDFIINYDQIDLEDVEFYLTSRVDRYSYLSMMPILEKIYKHRKDEMKKEKEFMKFVVGRNLKNLSDLTEKEVIARVVEAVIWWKYKNKWKRPILQDDTKALRMIEERILSKNYDSLTKYK